MAIETHYKDEVISYNEKNEMWEWFGPDKEVFGSKSLSSVKTKIRQWSEAALKGITAIYSSYGSLYEVEVIAQNKALDSYFVRTKKGTERVRRFSTDEKSLKAANPHNMEILQKILALKEERNNFNRNSEATERKLRESLAPFTLSTPKETSKKKAAAK